MEGTESATLTHAELEDQVERRGREVQRLMFQDHLDLRALREQRVGVVDAEGVVHATVEPGHRRLLATVMGTVNVQRLAYRHLGASNLHPADATLNLPVERHSHGLRRLAAIESTRGSFDDAAAAIERSTGVAWSPNARWSPLTAVAATDVEDFYAARAPEPGTSDDVVVISVDGKGIVMRPDALREATAKAAGAATPKLGSRLSKGEKRYRKRMAEVGAVYDLAPVARTPVDVLASKHSDDAPAPLAPKATGKWVTASVAQDAAQVVGSRL